MGCLSKQCFIPHILLKVIYTKCKGTITRIKAFIRILTVHGIKHKFLYIFIYIRDVVVVFVLKPKILDQDELLCWRCQPITLRGSRWRGISSSPRRHVSSLQAWLVATHRMIAAGSQLQDQQYLKLSFHRRDTECIQIPRENVKMRSRIHGRLSSV